MFKALLKLNLISLLLISSQINSMHKGLFSKIVTGAATRSFGTGPSKHANEEAAVKKSLSALTLALRAAGYTEFEILIMNRKDQQLWCSKSFCCYSRNIIDPKGTSILKGDPKAICLCTRQDRFDTPGHVLQARLKSDELE